jgi:MFS family permease
MSHASEPVSPGPRTGWASLKDLTGYHWFVFVVCSLAWDLDCMDQQLFVLARDPALEALMHKPAGDPDVAAMSTYATSVFLIGWAIGGIGFGVLGDRIGRVKTLTATIGLYALFTGLSSLSVSEWDFILYRLLTGLGVGGAFASAVVLLAETVPDNARPYVLGLFQASSVMGNCTAALLNMYLGSLEKQGAFPAEAWLTPWRVMFLVGIVPGVLLVVVQLSLREPAKWVALRAAEASGRRPSAWRAFWDTLTGIFTTPPWSRHLLLGLLLTGAGVIGLWGIAFFSPRLVQLALSAALQADGLTGAQLKGEISWWRGMASLVQNGGAFLGIFAFSWVTGMFGRRTTFAAFFVLAMVSTAGTFWFLRTRDDVFWMLPIMGFCQLALFGGYAIYLPELFPTRYRSTGTSFCYNAGRLVAAVGPFALGKLTSEVYVGYGADAFRYAGVTMCSVFFVGLLVLPWLPETKGKALPE